MNRTLVRLFGSSRTLFALRLALTVAWAGIASGTLLSPRLHGARAIALGAFAFAVFLLAMWVNLARAPRSRTTATTLALLVLQAISGIAMATDLMLLVAMELPLVLKPRHAAIGFVLLVALVTLVGLVLARAGAFVAAPELAGMSASLQVGLTLGSVAGWQLLAFSGGLLAATEIRARRDVNRLMAELRLTNSRLEETSRDAERMHIARELHDTVGHRLAALGVSLDLESRRAEGASAASLREARDATQQLLAEVREVVGAMRQEQPVDLKRAVAALVSGLGTIDVELTISPGLEVRDRTSAHALLRCAQEALTNTVRHARAASVKLDLRQDSNGVTLSVRDDGEGAADLREGNGLRGMRERLETLGGTLRVGSRSGRGFEVLAWLPPVECAR